MQNCFLCLIFQPLLLVLFLIIHPFLMIARVISHYYKPPQLLNKNENQNLARYFDASEIQPVRICRGPSLMTRIVLWRGEQAFVLGDVIYSFLNPIPAATLRHEFTHVLQFRNHKMIPFFLSNYFAYLFSALCTNGFDADKAYFSNPAEVEAFQHEEIKHLEWRISNHANGKLLDRTQMRSFRIEIK